MKTVRAVDLIRKKRDGGELTAEEIRWLVDGYVRGTVPDYQMSAFLMAVYFRGMSDSEILALTEAMIGSGERLDLSGLGTAVVDKHSTGGVGDKTTLVLIPLVAACGVPVVKMSGRGLGHTGGTADKLESIPGFRTELSLAEMLSVVRRAGACIATQTGNLTPADKKLYALRDVTATVESLPLIAASVMSKKLAAGADALVLDVKCGRGALLAEQQEAERLARIMTDLARRAGKRAVALITDMNQPLGYAVGNALEVKEAVLTLRGEGPPDLVALVVALGAEMLTLAGCTESTEEGARRIGEALRSGAGLDKLRDIVAAQRGDPRAVDDLSLLPQAPCVKEVPARSGGYVHAVDALRVGLTAMALGAGRAAKDDPIDPAVGIELAVKVGDAVTPGQVLGRVHARDGAAADWAAAELLASVSIAPQPARPLPLIRARLASS